MKRVISIILAAMLIVSLLPTAAFAAEYTDTQGHWGERPIDRWSDYGVVAGKGNGIFDPNGPMTRGEAAQVFANLFRLTAKADLSGYTDVGLGMWYDDAIAKCVKAGIMSGKGDGVMDPEGPITREEFFVMFANALGIKPETTAEVAVADSAQASSWAADYITALVNKGYVNGTSSVANGIVVQPKLNINRASVMALLDKTITTYVNTSEAVAAGDGLILIVCDDADISLKDSTGKAELYVFGDNVKISSAPVGTTVTTADVAGTKVNGKSLSKDTTIVVEKRKSSGSSTPAETTYTVTFDVQGLGTAPAAITVTSGAAITSPAAISAEGHTFGGWYKEVECVNEWNFDTDVVTADTTLYAKWTIAVNPVISTIADVLATVGEFPTSSDSTPVPAPDAAWVTAKGEKCYIWRNDLYFAKAGGDGRTSTNRGCTVEEIEGNYVSAFQGQTIGKITFKMTENVLTEIIVENYGSYNGTYTAPVDSAIGTIADVLATYDGGFPTTSTMSKPEGTWENADGTKWCYRYTASSTDDLYFRTNGGGSTIHCSESVTQSGSDYIYTTGSITFTFKMTSDKLTSIEVSGTSTVDGTYGPAVPVTGVSIDKTSATVEVGDTVTLNATITPDNATNKNVTWSSSNESVATVDNGMVTGVAFGTATITVTSVDGSKTASCTVTVKETKTMADLLATNTDIPEVNNLTPPQDAWVNSTDFDCKAFVGIDAEKEKLFVILKKDSGLDPLGMCMDDEFERIDNDTYQRVEETVGTFTIKMTNGKFTSYEFEAASGSAYEVLNGTYTDPIVASCTMETGAKWFSTLTSGTAIKKTSIVAIVFSQDTPTGQMEVAGVDLTANKTGNVKGYVEKLTDDPTYKIHIVGEKILGNANCQQMFNGFTNLTQLDLGDFDTSNVTIMYSMFNGCSTLTSLNLSSFDTSNVTVMFNMFNGCSGLTFLDLSSFDTSETSNMQSMFTGCSKLESITFGTKFNTSKVTSMVSMFKGCSALKSLDLSSFDTSAVNQGMSSMFQDCSTLTSLNLGSFDTSNVTAMGSMFNGCSALKSLDLSKLDTSAVTDMNGMFTGCSKLESITFGTNFNTSKVTGMNAMFSGCSALKSLDLSSFDTSAVTNMDAMFKNCSTLESLDLSKFDTSAVDKMSNVFNGCSTLERLDISYFTVGDETTVEDMFEDCSKLTSVKINAANDKIKTVLGEGWTYNGETKAYEKQPAAPPTVTYMDWDDTNKKLVEKPIPAEAIEVTNTTTSLEGGKFYVVKGTDVQTGTLTVTGTGTATLILMDGAKLTATGASQKAGINVASGKALIITGQSGGTGVLIANGSVEGAGIGGDSGEGGTITINCGTITATGGYDGAGIGGGDHGNGGNVTINGGTLTAIGGYGGAGIGGGYQGDGGTLTINGGTVNATGGDVAAGIGGGLGYGGGSVTINGGTVTATGGAYAAGIGGSQGSDISGGTVIINGGSVTATGMDGGAGIGGGDYGDGANVTINDGTITATGSDGATAIGKGKSGEKTGTVDFGTGKDFAIKAGTDAENTTDMTEEEYESNHSAKYVKIEESEGK